MGIFDRVSRIVKPVFGGASKAVKKIIEAPKEAAETVKEVAKTAVEAVKETGKKIYEGLPGPIQDILKEAYEQGNQALTDTIERFIDELPQELRGPAASLLSQYWGMLWGDIKVNDKLIYFDSLDRELATYAKDIYKGTQRKQIGTYILDEDISLPSKYGVWVDPNNKIVINALRGTVPTDIKDLVSDLAIAAGKEQNDPQFKAMFKKWQEVVDKYPLNEYKHRMTGHSLGGGFCYHIAMTQPNYPNDRITCFSPGVGASNKYRDFLKECKNGSPRCSNLRTYKFEGDPVALLAGLGKVNITKAKSINPVANHTMDNY